MPSTIADHLPEFYDFLQRLTDDVRVNKISSWEAFATAINTFYTPKQMQKIEAVASGWIQMASYQNGAVLIHVTSVFVTLMLSPEYHSATPEQRTLMEWVVLFHDITKVPVPNGHDYVHAFKSAAIAGNALTKLGFPTSATITQIDAWCDFTYHATVYSEEYNETIQDITKLPQIAHDLKIIHNQDAYAIVLVILLHLAIVTDPHYPILAPMTTDHMTMSITPHSLPIMRGLFLADGNSYELFTKDQSIAQQRRRDVLRVLEEIESLIDEESC